MKKKFNVDTWNIKHWQKRWDRAYFHVDFDNIPPTVDIDIKNKGGKNGKECSYHGKKYSHGDIFPSNSSGIIPTSKKQCVNCACTVSTMFCICKFDKVKVDVYLRFVKTHHSNSMLSLDLTLEQ